MTKALAAPVIEEIERPLRDFDVPGCSLALVDRTGVVWSGGVGWSDLRERRGADERTVYHLFSGTKLFTAAAVVRLAERGALSLDDSVASVLPEHGSLVDITLTDLLSHRSGFRDSLRSFLAVRFPGEPARSTAEALAAYSLRRSEPPRRQVAYRNVNYALLGEVVTRVSGVPYERYVTREILEPVGMSAAFDVSAAPREHLATGYMNRFDPMRMVVWALLPNTRGRLYAERTGGVVALRPFDLVTAAIGGLVGTVPDFARFVHSQLTDGGGVLAPDSVRRMQTMVATGSAGIVSREGVGLGWKIGRVDGRPFLNHEGGGAGFTSELRLYPEAGIGVALAMNGMRMPTTMRLAHRLCEILYRHRGELGASS